MSSTKTVLFFGDSNTRGYGVDPQLRWASLVEEQLRGATREPWTYAVASSWSDFKAIPKRLEAALAEYDPSIVVMACPTGPAAYYLHYPEWARKIGAVNRRIFAWADWFHVRAAMRSAKQSSERDVRYEGRYVDALHRWQILRWPGARQLNRWMGSHYGVRVKATRERYLEWMEQRREQIRSQTAAPILFLSLIPHSDDYHPGYLQRAREWNRDLAALLDRPAEGSHYLDLFEPLAGRPTADMLLRDGTHLSPRGHSVVAPVIAPFLQQLMAACARTAPLSQGEG